MTRTTKLARKYTKSTPEQIEEQARKRAAKALARWKLIKARNKAMGIDEREAWQEATTS